MLGCTRRTIRRHNATDNHAMTATGMSQPVGLENVTAPAPDGRPSSRPALFVSASSASVSVLGDEALEANGSDAALSCIAAATAARTSSSADTSQALRHARMRFQIGAPLVIGRPVASPAGDRRAQIVGKLQRFAGCHPAFLLDPETLLHRGHALPITSRECDQILPAHGVEDTRRSPCQSGDVAECGIFFVPASSASVSVMLRFRNTLKALHWP